MGLEWTHAKLLSQGQGLLVVGFCLHVIGGTGVGMDDATRLLFRSTHIYLLFMALLNQTLGLYLAVEPSGWRRWIRRSFRAE